MPEYLTHNLLITNHLPACGMTRNNSGTLEFAVPGNNLDVFFPLAVSFFSRSVYSDVDIEAVAKVADNSPVQFGFEKLLSTENYQIV
jgi:coatomer subunit delta